VNTDSTVVELAFSRNGGRHRLVVAGPGALTVCESRQVILAMGCFETSRGSRLIPGTRPAGVFTTGTLQKLVNLQKLRPARRAVIIGSEHVAFSAALTLRQAGIKIVAMLEPAAELHTYRLPAFGLSRWLGFPILKARKIEAICGRERVESVKTTDMRTGRQEKLPCDAVVITGSFQPEASLLYKTGLELDPWSLGPVVDDLLETSVEGVFAAGNVLRGANMHDLCALEGARAAQGVLRRIKGRQEGRRALVRIIPEVPIRWVTPHRVDPSRILGRRTSWFKDGFSFQTSQTMEKVEVSAVAGGKCIWRKTYGRLIANNTVPLPVENFAWPAAGEGT